MTNTDGIDRCLVCYQPMDDAEGDYHDRCSKLFFGVAHAPTLPYTLGQINELAEQVVRRRIAVPGVQPKLSLHLEKHDKEHPADPRRLTIVGLWGMYIFKPPSPDYRELPELEDATMHLAEIAGIQTVPHGLIRFASGELGYLTRRIDRVGKNGKKRHLEDLCQLTDKLTEQKYKGSMEQAGSAIARFSSNPGIDVIAFLELALFNFLVGNADMHLKNFSMVHDSAGEQLSVSLAPAYDLVATTLILPADKEESALPLQGKKSNLEVSDFVKLGRYLEVDTKAMMNSFQRLRDAIPPMLERIDISFLSEGMRREYKALLLQRAATLELI
jgi:serine/threonine-protein kinase HipA